MVPWEEEVQEDAFVVRFAGIDVASKDRDELASFARDLAKPASEDGATFGQRFGGVLLALGVLLGFFAMSALSQIAHALRLDVGFWPFPILFLACVLAPLAVVAYRERDAPAARRPYTARFVLTLSADGLVVEGGSERKFYEADDIAHFEGGHRLSVVTRSGSRLALPCAFEFLPRIDHPALAARLQDEFRRLTVERTMQRAAAAGYRGESPKLRAETPDEDLEGAVDEPSPGKRARR